MELFTPKDDREEIDDDVDVASTDNSNPSEVLQNSLETWNLILHLLKMAVWACQRNMRPCAMCYFRQLASSAESIFFLGLSITDLCFAFDSTTFQAFRVRNTDIFYRSLKIYWDSACHDPLYIRDMETVIHFLGELTGKKNLREKELIKKVFVYVCSCSFRFIAWKSWNMIIVHKKCYSTSSII